MRRMHRLRFLIYFVVAFVFASGVLLALLRHSGFFLVAAIPVEVVSDGEKTNSYSAIESRLKTRLDSMLGQVKGKKIWQIDINGVRAALARDEWVKDVIISRSFPNEVRVVVRSKAPAAVLISSQGLFLPVTEHGQLLSALPGGSLPDVPLLRGEIFKTDQPRRMTVIKFLQTLPIQGPMNTNNISEVGWNNEDGYTLTLMQPKVEVKLGEDRVDLKALRVAQVMNYLTANSLKGRVIDASYSKKVLVRLRKGP